MKDDALKTYILNLKNQKTMKKFKKGDRVLVRDNDLQEWEVRTLSSVNKDLAWPFLDTEATEWTQCRHIDDFRTGDKVQVSNDGKNWKDAEYVGYFESRKNGECCESSKYNHVATTKSYNWAVQYKLCRWHPSMPWADTEEPLTLEQRVEALERKMNEL